jgi:choline kinase
MIEPRRTSAGGATRRAVILSAGQGRRLLPLTADRPKCLLNIGGKTILEWQLDALLAAGIADVAVVTGYLPDTVEALIARRYAGSGVHAVFNPFFDITDNLASCWVVRNFMDGDFLLMNGDTVFEPELLKTVLASPAAPVTLTVDRKATYDEDDMKVELDGLRVLHVSKKLPLDRVQAESIGLLYFRGDGGQLFRAGVEHALRHEKGLKRFYLAVVDELAGQDRVRACAISGLRWAEIDFPIDVPVAESLFAAR